MFLIIKAPVIGRFFWGPEEYRARWLMAQMAAWCASMVYMAAGIIFWMREPFGKTFGGAIGSHFIPTTMAVSGFYLGALVFMPAAFFDASKFGKRLMKFFGTDRGDTARITAVFCVVFSLVSSIAVWWTKARRFSIATAWVCICVVNWKKPNKPC